MIVILGGLMPHIATKASCLMPGCQNNDSPEKNLLVLYVTQANPKNCLCYKLQFIDPAFLIIVSLSYLSIGLLTLLLHDVELNPTDEAGRLKGIPKFQGHVRSRLRR